MKFYTLYLSLKEAWRRSIKFFLIMKLTILFLIVTCLHVKASVYGQTITLSKKDASLENVFKEIERQSGYLFWFEDVLVKSTVSVNVQVKSATIEQVLDQCFKDQPLTYEIVDKIIVVKRKEFIASTIIFVDIKGKVTDEKGEPLPGASIKVKGTNKATSSDVNGEFTILGIDPNAVFVISFLGFVTQEVPIYNKNSITVILKEDTKGLNEIVVVGYQSIRRGDLTGAVSSVGSEQLKDIPIFDTAQALAGRLAGVQVISSDGKPGAEANIVIRGGGSITQSNAPLYIIDGLEVEDGLSAISPSDIESIDVLKDAASTAIYGARGGNGVVLITTKGGKAMKTQAIYEGFSGVRSFNRRLEVMDPYNFVLRQYEGSRGSSSDEDMFKELYGDFDNLDSYQAVTGENWQQSLFGRDAMMQNHDIRVVGGTENTKFNIGYRRSTEDGVMLGADFGRNQVNLRFDHNANKLKVGLNMRYTDQVVNGAGVAEEGQGGDAHATYSLLRHAIKYSPVLDPGVDINQADEDYFNETGGGAIGILNPIEQSNSRIQEDLRKTVNIGGFTEYAFNKTLSVRSNIGISLYNFNRNRFDDYTTSVARVQGGGLPVVNTYGTSSVTTNIQNILTYKQQLGSNHRISVLLGQQYYGTKSEGLTNELFNFPLGITPEKAFGQLSLGESTPLHPNSLLTESKIMSFFTAINYSFKDKYLLTVNARADGSSKFAANERWGYFPAGAFAWRISEENFLKDVSFLSDAKLRISYGLSGNNRIADYLYQNVFAANTRYSLNEVINLGYSSTSLANKKLIWESTTSRNIGLDVGLFNNRISFIVDAYKNDVSDLLLYVPIPSTTGYDRQLQNIGSTSNKGLEFQINAIPVKSKNFNWSTNFNLSFNKNTIKELARGQNSYLEAAAVRWTSGQPSDYIVQVGKPVGSMFGFESDGFYKTSDFDYDQTTQIYTLKTGVVDVSKSIGMPQPGWMKLKDLDGDGIVDVNDRTIIGNAAPKFVGGLNQQFTYKNFDLSVFLNFVYGNNIYNANKVEFTNSSSLYTNMLAVMEDRWRTIDGQGNRVQWLETVSGQQVVKGISPQQLEELNKEAKIWIPISGAGAFYPTSWAIEDGSYLRVNNITVGYSLPTSILNRIKVNDFRIYATANNVAVFTNYSGYDPDVNVRSNPVTPGVDYSAYPRSRAFVFGVRLTL